MTQWSASQSITTWLITSIWQSCSLPHNTLFTRISRMHSLCFLPTSLVFPHVLCWLQSPTHPHNVGTPAHTPFMTSSGLMVLNTHHMPMTPRFKSGAQTSLLNCRFMFLERMDRMGVYWVDNWQEMLNIWEEQIGKQGYLILWNDQGHIRKVIHLW